MTDKRPATPKRKKPGRQRKLSESTRDVPAELLDEAWDAPADGEGLHYIPDQFDENLE